MKVNNKSILITDPCYFAKNKHWGKEFDWISDQIRDIPEITNYLWTPTGIGDGRFEVLELEEVNKDFVKDYLRELSDSEDKEDKYTYKSLYNLLNYIGEFSVDSGTMCVAIYDEVMKYNPDFKENISDLCYCIIEDFTGTIDIMTDENGINHFIIENDDKLKPLIITY
jgi:hypothetical protein